MRSVEQLLAGLLLAGAFACNLPASRAADAGSAAKPASAAAVTRTVLRRQDLDIPGREVVMVAVVIPPRVAEGMHTHPADLFAFVEQGELTLEIEGQATKTYKVGETAFIPSGKRHQGINAGQVTVKLAAVLVAQKDQPLTVPAP
jgi:quercetin dioxygenase-like cupin family protein